MAVVVTPTVVVVVELTVIGTAATVLLTYTVVLPVSVVVLSWVVEVMVRTGHHCGTVAMTVEHEFNVDFVHCA